MDAHVKNRCIMFGNTLPALIRHLLAEECIAKCLGHSHEIEEAVKHAIEYGYRHIDTAYIYANEREVGRAIRAKINEGVINREDIFVVTKLWCTHHEPDKVLPALKESLNNLGLSYIDLYLIHFPVGFNEQGGLNDVDYVDTWKAMESLAKKGLTRSIGLSNFNSEQIDRILKTCEIKPVVNQVECHLAFNQKNMIEFCKQRDIRVVAYSPLGHNIKESSFLYDVKLKNIGEKYGKTPPQVALRYLIQIGTIPIPKSITTRRIQENFNIFDFELSTEDIKALETFHNGQRKIKFHFVDAGHKYYPFNLEF